MLVVDEGYDYYGNYFVYVYGVGKLDVVLEGNILILYLDSLLINLVGFEYVVSSGKDKDIVCVVVKNLCEVNCMFVIDVVV